MRRECLDQVIVWNETHLRRLLRDYLTYYHRDRTHLSLEKDAPEPRPMERPDHGAIVEMPVVGGLRHRYTRLLRRDRHRPLCCPATRKWPVSRVRLAAVGPLLSL
jgi:hypothetical protein